MEMVKGEPTQGVIDTLPKGHKVWAGSFISNTLVLTLLCGIMYTYKAFHSGME